MGTLYRDEIYSQQILLSRTQAGPGRTVKQEQEEISPSHVQRLNLISVHLAKQKDGREREITECIVHLKIDENDVAETGEYSRSAAAIHVSAAPNYICTCRPYSDPQNR